MFLVNYLYGGIFLVQDTRHGKLMKHSNVQVCAQTAKLSLIVMRIDALGVSDFPSTSRFAHLTAYGNALALGVVYRIPSVNLRAVVRLDNL